MKKLLTGVLLGVCLLLTGCERNIFTLPVKENPEALLRFNQPAEYAYNRRHFLVNPAKCFWSTTGATPNELQQDSGWQRPAE